MSAARQQEEMETDAEPFDEPQSRGRGATAQRGRMRDKPSSHSSVSAQGMDTALSYLSPRERADVQQALRDAEEAVRSVGHLSGSGAISKSMPSSALPGGVNIQNFSNCENIHIGETHVVTNHNYGHYGHNRQKPEQTKAQQMDEDIKRLLGSPTLLVGSDATSLADNVGSGWRRLGKSRLKDTLYGHFMEFFTNLSHFAGGKSGRALGLLDGQLDNYKNDYNSEGQHEIIYQMIRGWMKKSGAHGTVGVMVKALVSVRMIDVARKVFVKRR